MCEGMSDLDGSETQMINKKTYFLLWIHGDDFCLVSDVRVSILFLEKGNKQKYYAKMNRLGDQKI